jgi:hypothetical protein
VLGVLEETADLGGASMTLDLSSLAANPDLVRLNPELLNCPAESDTPKVRKYRNTPTVYAGREYASAREATRARDLDLMRKAGEIVYWWPQVPFPLSQGVKYVADFVVLLPDLSVRVEDSKGVRTKEYRIKAKLFKARYGRTIDEV